MKKDTTTKNIYKDLYNIIPTKGVIKHELSGIYVTPKDIWCTDSFRAITVRREHENIDTPVFIPANIVKAMAGYVEDITITHETVTVNGLALAIPQDIQGDRIQWYENARKHTDSMILDASTGVFPIINGALLASTLDYITDHEKFMHVNIYHSDNVHAPITITSESITALLMPTNK